MKPGIYIQHWQTENGVRVYFVERHELPLVDMSLCFNAGSSQDGLQPGISNLTNIMLNQGTESANVDDIATRFSNVGAQFSTNSDRDMGVISFRSLTNHPYVSAALNQFCEIAVAPSFPDQAFNRMQKLTLNAINKQMQHPEMVAKNILYANLYAKHPYGHSVLGNPKSVTKLSTNDLKQFYRKYYVAHNACLTIVGDLTRKQAERIAGELTQKLRDGEHAQQPPMPSALKQDFVIHTPFPSNQSHIILGSIGINYSDPRYYPLLLANYILGGSPLTSRLFKEIREKRGLTYTLTSALIPQTVNGSFVVLLQTRNQKAHIALKLSRSILDQFARLGPTQAELSSAKRRLCNSFPLSISCNSDLAKKIQTIALYGLTPNHLNEYCNNINTVSLAQVKTALKECIASVNKITVIVGGK